MLNSTRPKLDFFAFIPKPFGAFGRQDFSKLLVRYDHVFPVETDPFTNPGAAPVRMGHFDAQRLRVAHVGSGCLETFLGTGGGTIVAEVEGILLHLGHVAGYELLNVGAFEVRRCERGGG